MKTRTFRIDDGTPVDPTLEAFNENGDYFSEKVKGWGDFNRSYRANYINSYFDDAINAMNGIAFDSDNRPVTHFQPPAALRKAGAPNHADQPGQLRDGNVPHNSEILHAFGLDYKYIYADYEFLLGRHPEYFKDAEEARAAVEFVLNAPQYPHKMRNGNIGIIRREPSDGNIYRAEVKLSKNGKELQVRSIHEISQIQLDKIKKSAVTDTPKEERRDPFTSEKQDRKTQVAADFLRYDKPVDGKVKWGKNKKNDILYQVDTGSNLLAPNGEVSKLKEKQWIQVRTPAFKKWFGDWENDPENVSKVVDENGEPLVVYHGTGEKFHTFKKEKLGSRENAFFLPQILKVPLNMGTSLSVSFSISHEWLTLTKIAEIQTENLMMFNHLNSLKTLTAIRLIKSTIGINTLFLNLSKSSPLPKIPERSIRRIPTSVTAVVFLRVRSGSHLKGLKH